MEAIGYLPNGRAKATYMPLVLDCVAEVSPACAAAQNTMYWRPRTLYRAGMPSIASETCISHSIFPSFTSKARTFRSRVPVITRPPAVITGPTLGC